MKKTILKEAVVLLILASLIFSSVAIAGNTEETSKIIDTEIVTLCSPSIDVKKDVWDPDSGWTSANSEDTAADLPICENTEFRIRVWNTGDCPVTGGVMDDMDDRLTYETSDPEPDDFAHIPPFYWMIWAFTEPINPGDVGPVIIIEAHVGGPPCAPYRNHAYANFTCAHGTFVEDEDSAWVHPYEKSRVIKTPFLNWLENHPNMFPLLQRLLQRLGL